jgi:MoaA/NifB/PqqE/SkfB family radical SAM enzyme
LITNATLLSTEAVERLKKAGIRLLAISIHGADAITHDKFCGIEGSWERVMAGVHNTINARIPFQINTSIHHYNLEQFSEMVKLADDLGAIAIEPLSFLPIGRGKEHPDYALNEEERHNFAGQIIHHQLNDRNMIFRCFSIPQIWVELKKKIVNKEEQSIFERACCGAAMRYAFVFFDGTVYPCWVLHKAAGNVKTQSFQDIWKKSEVFKTLRNRDKLEGKCGKCGYKLFCGGPRCIVFEKSGSLSKGHETCWFPEKELHKPIVIQETGCEHCGKDTISVCQVCESPICSEHSMLCAYCNDYFCNPAVKDCMFVHKCK